MMKQNFWICLSLSCLVVLTAYAEPPDEESDISKLRAKLIELNVYAKLSAFHERRTASAQVRDEDAATLAEAVEVWSHGVPPITENNIFNVAVQLATQMRLPAVLNRLREVVADERQDVDRREFAMNALSYTKDASLVPLFARIANDRVEPRLNGSAVSALAYLATKESRAALETISIHHPDRDSVARAARENIEIVDWLIIARDTDRPWAERKKAIEQLAQSPYPVAGVSVEELKRDEEDAEHAKEIGLIQEHGLPIIYEKLRNLR